jgi:hypothetical protein
MVNPLSFHKNQSHQVDNKGPLNMVVLGSPSALSPLQMMIVSSSNNKSLVLGRRSHSLWFQCCSTGFLTQLAQFQFVSVTGEVGIGKGRC